MKADSEDEYEELCQQSSFDTSYLECPLEFGQGRNTSPPDFLIVKGLEDQQRRFYLNKQKKLIAILEKYKKEYESRTNIIIKTNICLVSDKFNYRIKEDLTFKMFRDKYNDQVIRVVFDEPSKFKIEKNEYKQSGFDSDEELQNLQMKKLNLKEKEKKGWTILLYNQDHEQNPYRKVAYDDVWFKEVGNYLKKIHLKRYYFLIIKNRVLKPTDKFHEIQNWNVQKGNNEIIAHVFKQYRRAFLQQQVLNKKTFDVDKIYEISRKKTKDLTESKRKTLLAAQNSWQIKYLEQVALKLYTSEFYKYVNQMLRNQETIFCQKIDQNSDMLGFVSCLYWGVYRLKAFSGKVYRGNHSFDFANHYQVGQTFCFKGFTSTSKRKEKAKNFSKKGEKSVVFKIKSKTGRDISNLSSFPHEGQVIFLPYTYFLIEEIIVSKSMTDYTKVTIVQIPYPNFEQTKKLILFDKAEIMKQKDIQYIKKQKHEHVNAWVDQFKNLLEYKKCIFKVVVDGKKIYQKTQEQCFCPDPIIFNMKLFKHLIIKAQNKKDLAEYWNKVKGQQLIIFQPHEINKELQKIYSQK